MTRRTLLSALFVLTVLPFALACSSAQDGITSWVDGTSTVGVGDRFEITAHVKNESGSVADLDSIDIGDSYLEGVRVVGSEPAFMGTMPVADGTLSHSFSHPVQPGETVAVTFQMEAVQPGTHQGDFDICVNSVWDCNFLSVTTVVQGSPASQAP